MGWRTRFSRAAQRAAAVFSSGVEGECLAGCLSIRPWLERGGAMVLAGGWWRCGAMVLAGGWWRCGAMGSRCVEVGKRPNLGRVGRRPGAFGLRVLSPWLPPCASGPVTRGHQNGRNPAKPVGEAVGGLKVVGNGPQRKRGHQKPAGLLRARQQEVKERGREALPKPKTLKPATRPLSKAVGSRTQPKKPIREGTHRDRQTEERESRSQRQRGSDRPEEQARPKMQRTDGQSDKEGSKNQSRMRNRDRPD